ncbi:Ben and cat operon transcriptional regulator (plasmid) [Marinibacterium anthonyi]|nr:Ben and cat operon transcriptional regulator [Marinibacterium anthonyi]
MAQPPLSRQIKQLEDQLGAVLFDRGRASIGLTQAGAHLLEEGQFILQRIEQIKLEVKQFGTGASGRLRIGHVGSAVYGALPLAVRDFREKYPDVWTSLLPMNNYDLREALVQRQIDVAISRSKLTDSAFRSRLFHSEDMNLVVPKAFSPPTNNVVRLEDLSDCRFIQYPEFPRPSLADQIFNLCAEHGFEVRRKGFTQDIHTALSLVAAGDGVSIVPASIGVHCWPGLRALTIEPDLGVTELYLNSRLDDQGPHANNFIKSALSVSRRLGEQTGYDRASA